MLLAQDVSVYHVYKWYDGKGAKNETFDTDEIKIKRSDQK